jgi:uncharacterized membrane protein
VLVIFAYMGPLAIVALAAARGEFVKWHARQGLLLTGAAIVTFLLLRIPHTLLYLVSAFLGDMFLTLELLVLTGFLIVAVLGMVRGLEGERFRIPWFAEIVDRF